MQEENKTDLEMPEWLDDETIEFFYKNKKFDVLVKLLQADISYVWNKIDKEKSNKCEFLQAVCYGLTVDKLSNMRPSERYSKIHEIEDAMHTVTMFFFRKYNSR